MYVGVVMWPQNYQNETLWQLKAVFFMFVDSEADVVNAGW